MPGNHQRLPLSTAGKPPELDMAAPLREPPEAKADEYGNHFIAGKLPKPGH